MLPPKLIDRCEDQRVVKHHLGLLILYGSCIDVFLIVTFGKTVACLYSSGIEFNFSDAKRVVFLVDLLKKLILSFLTIPPPFPLPFSCGVLGENHASRF